MSCVLESWAISKEFHFCYGHRVHNQVLDRVYSLSSSCKCRHLHGHEAKVVVELSNDELNRGMVTDFNHLNWLKEWIDKNIDHKFIIDINDPLFKQITGVEPDSSSIDKPWGTFETQRIVAREATRVERELYESFVIVDFCPTSENLSKWIFDMLVKSFSHPDFKHFNISSVTWYESQKSKSTYRRIG